MNYGFQPLIAASRSWMHSPGGDSPSLRVVATILRTHRGPQQHPPVTGAPPPYFIGISTPLTEDHHHRRPQPPYRLRLPSVLTSTMIFWRERNEMRERSQGPECKYTSPHVLLTCAVGASKARSSPLCTATSD